MPATVSMPLSDARLFRPGPFFALTILLIPVVVALIGAVIALMLTGGIPVWLPFTLALWIPCMPAVWWVSQSVRANPLGLAVGRPWRRWQQVTWEMIERVEQRGPQLRITDITGQTIIIFPALLQDGARLKRLLLLRLPAYALIGALRQEAQELASGDTGESALSSSFSASPQRRWAALCLAVIAVVVAVALGALMLAPFTLALALCGAGAVVLVICGAILFWLLQRVTVNETGVAVRYPLPGRNQSLAWEQIEMIEYSPREVTMRMRGPQSVLRCAGPNMFTPAQRNLMRAYLHQQRETRGVPIIQRAGLL